MSTSPSGDRLAEPAVAAEARGRGYVLLADLLERGPLERWLEPIRASASLAAALETYPNLDEAEADHEYVFGQSVHPFAGVFVDEEARAGGPTTSRVQGALEELGYRADPTGPGLEHLATLLRALGFLSGAEVDARRDGEDDIREHLEVLTRRFIDAELLPWLGLFTGAVRRTERAWPVALVDHIDELVHTHRVGLGGEVGAAALELPPPTLDLESPESSLRDIAHHLAVPAFTGVLFSRHDITVIGRAHRAPRGFGPRARLLHTLLHSAVRYDAFGPVIDDLAGVVRLQLELLEGEDELSRALAAPFTARAAETLKLLETIRRAA